MFAKFLKFALFGIIINSFPPAYAEEGGMEIYIDADFSISAAAALAERGMKPVATKFFSAAIGDASVLNSLHCGGAGLRIYSHWDIMGRAFTEHVNDENRRALRLKALQTCALRRERDGNAVLTQALGRAAPDASWRAANITARRVTVHDALERLERPVPGILNTYDPPFRPFAEGAKGAHEALKQDDLCFAKFSAEGRLEDAK